MVLLIVMREAAFLSFDSCLMKWRQLKKFTNYVQYENIHFWFQVWLTNLTKRGFHDSVAFYLRAGVEDLQIELPAVNRQPLMVQGIWGEDEKWQ